MVLQRGELKGEVPSSDKSVNLISTACTYGRTAKEFIMNNSYTAGLAFGICFALIAYVIVHRISKDRLSGHYDERQELIRGRAYKYAAFTMMFLLLADLLADGFGLYDTTPLSHSVSDIFILMTGILIYAVYCIKNDPYFGVGINIRMYVITIVVVILLQVISLVMDFREDAFLVDGKLAFGPAFRIIFIIEFAIIMIALFSHSRNMADAESDDE